MPRKKIAAGNWKMNLTHEEGLQLARTLSNAQKPDDVLTILASPFIHLKSLVDLLLHVPNMDVAAQNIHHKENGAYTGEVSAPMVASLHVPYVILGHSERREYQHESNALLAEKLALALKFKLKVIFCCGESLEIRKQGSHAEFVKNQLHESLNRYSSKDLSNLTIAYEPIWAIGTGETATPAQAQEMHSNIREFLKEQFNNELAENIPVLYGGSVKPNNAKEIFSQPDVDGGLVGGASLKAEDFLEIIRSF